MSRPSPETKAAVLADYLDGMSQKAVARKYGISPSTAHRYIHGAGISRDVKTAQRAGQKAIYDREYGLRNGRWVPNRRGVLVWEASIYADRKNNIETINQENSNAA